jgi:hypothetical protein
MQLHLFYFGFLDPRVGEITMFHRFQGTAGNLADLILVKRQYVFWNDPDRDRCANQTGRASFGR